MEPCVRREVVLEEELDEVWRALTEPERLAEWFANEVDLVAEPGAAGVFRWDDGSARVAVVEEVEPERRFAFRWHDEDASGLATRVELTLEEAAAGTRLTVVETPLTVHASALAGEWSWGVSLLAALPRLRRVALA